MTPKTGVASRVGREFNNIPYCFSADFTMQIWLSTNCQNGYRQTAKMAIDNLPKWL
jgi:hypothetical protein